MKLGVGAGGAFAQVQRQRQPGRQNDIRGGKLLESSLLLKTKHRIRLRFVKV